MSVFQIVTPSARLTVLSFCPLSTGSASAAGGELASCTADIDSQKYGLAFPLPVILSDRIAGKKTST